jgi:hypothetical protein
MVSLLFTVFLTALVKRRILWCHSWTLIQSEMRLILSKLGWDNNRHSYTHNHEWIWVLQWCRLVWISVVSSSLVLSWRNANRY